jgi:ribosome-associated heat shock protein Hsp15
MELRAWTNGGRIIRAYNRAVARLRHGQIHRHAAGDGAAADPGDAPGGSLRIDKWLWCVRFFKTRSVAQEAVDGGHVQVNGERAKASRQVKPGDRLSITRSQERFEVDVLSIPSRRGPSTEARQHYRETGESEAARAHVRELNRLSAPMTGGRPDKRERRELMRYRQGQSSPSDDGDEP